MSKFNIGDTVQFANAEEELKGKVFMISHTEQVGDKEEICLEGFSMYTFSAEQFELVKKCPYKKGDRVSINAVYWNQDRNYFVVDEVVGTVTDSGYIEFDQRTMASFCVPVNKLGVFWSNEENGNDFDVVFCLSLKEEIQKAKKLWLDVLDERVKDLEEELNELKNSREELKKQLL